MGMLLVLEVATGDFGLGVGAVSDCPKEGSAARKKAKTIVKVARVVRGESFTVFSLKKDGAAYFCIRRKR